MHARDFLELNVRLYLNLRALRVTVIQYALLLHLDGIYLFGVMIKVLCNTESEVKKRETR